MASTAQRDGRDPMFVAYHDVLPAAAATACLVMK
jgi:hypothetical protein